MEIKIRPARPEDAKLLVPRAIGTVDLELTKVAIESSREAWIAFVDDEPTLIWGVAQMQILDAGELWVVTTKAVERCKLAFLRRSRRFVREALRRYGGLQGYVEDGCPMDWIEWMGFEFDDPSEAYGLKVRRFEQWL